MKYELLSYDISNNTPMYGYRNHPKISRHKCIENGDSCNSSRISLYSHTSTHVDVGRHFLTDGDTITSFSARDWIFEKVATAFIPRMQDELFRSRDVALINAAEDIDALLIVTGFGGCRDTETYIFANPGFTPEFCLSLVSKYPKLRCLGFDVISLSANKHAREGREAHEVLLKRPRFVIVEDMNLSMISEDYRPSALIVAPMLVKDGDGAPATVFGTFAPRPE